MTLLNHVCYHVLEMERSLVFYEEALGLTPQREMTIANGTQKLVFLGDGETEFRLELSQVEGRTAPYDLGESGLHVGFVTDEYEKLHEKHRAMGCITGELLELQVYFIEDPDGHCLEVVKRKD